VQVFFGICATAPEIVDIVFGQMAGDEADPRGARLWRPRSAPILLLLPPYLQGKIGDFTRRPLCTMIGLVVFSPRLLLGSEWGIMGVCYAWLRRLSACLCAERPSLPPAAAGSDMAALSCLSHPVQPMVAGAAS